MNSEILIYQNPEGNIKVDVRLEEETVWLTQAQLCELFNKSKATISEHIKNVFEEGELVEKSNVQNLHIAFSDKPVKLYNLDIVISVGYRVKSLEGTRFHQWATKTLREHITKGDTINSSRIEKNYQNFLDAVEKICALLPGDQKAIDADSILELIKLFADTWFSLDAYDRDQLTVTGTTKRKVKPTAEKLAATLTKLKNALIAKNEATDIFGVERSKIA